MSTDYVLLTYYCIAVVIASIVGGLVPRWLRFSHRRTELIVSFVAGTMLGVALAIGIVLNLRNGLGLANVEANTQTGVNGALLIVSVLVQNLLDRLPLRRREAEA